MPLTVKEAIEQLIQGLRNEERSSDELGYSVSDVEVELTIALEEDAAGHSVWVVAAHGNDIHKIKLHLRSSGEFSVAPVEPLDKAGFDAHFDAPSEVWLSKNEDYIPPSPPTRP
ncbi:trypco2 family protein [Bradyrhizobium amphicarpaeae]|uniref:trypco2 family protein n=1 Tax=Bradyrhizobium amphicarpaeae TaxID=1404768 RepID=UPI0011E4CBD0|nr:trypco2 family protein [Bradyrhizobium amphicarpaeae]